MAKIRVIHFGTGGGSGVTRVVTDLGLGHAAAGQFVPLIVFRRKRRRPVAADFGDELTTHNVSFREVCQWPKFRVIAQLRKIIREFRPDIFVAHGYSEHLWGRVAARAEKVPVVVQVEHNHERYKWNHLRRSIALAAHTDAIVTVSQAVGETLIRQGLPSDRMQTIYNGVRLERFTPSPSSPFIERRAEVLMAARFGRQKDQATLIEAAALLRDRGYPVQVKLAGGGNGLHLRRCQRLSRRMGVEHLVEFLGPRHDVPELMRASQVFVLSTHFEGLPLSIIEAMAAGCAVVGTRAPGVEELIEPGHNGWLASPRDPSALADVIKAALSPAGPVMAARGQTFAANRFSLSRMNADYEQLLTQLVLAHRPREHPSICKRVHSPDS